MTAPNNLHIAESGFATPEEYSRPKKPLPPQVHKRYCLLILSGCCTEFFSNRYDVDARQNWLSIHASVPCEIYVLSDIIGWYVKEEAK